MIWRVPIEEKKTMIKLKGGAISKKKEEIECDRKTATEELASYSSQNTSTAALAPKNVASVLKTAHTGNNSSKI